jgi:hypothetical protein
MGSLRLEIAMRSGSPCGPTPAAPSRIRAPPGPSLRCRVPAAERQGHRQGRETERRLRRRSMSEAVGPTPSPERRRANRAAGAKRSAERSPRRRRRGANSFGGVAAAGCDRFAERIEISKRGGPVTPRRGGRPETKAAPPRRPTGREGRPAEAADRKRGYPAAARSSRAASTADWRRASSSWLMMARSAAGLTGLRMIARPVLRTCSRTCSP